MALHPTAVLAKSQKGFAELRTGRYELAPHLRALLAMVDGRQTAGRIVDRLRDLGPMEGELERLLTLGFVEDMTALPDGKGGYVDLTPGTTFELLDDAARLAVTKEFLEKSLASLEGVRAVGLRMRIKRCPSLDELSMLIDEYQARLTRLRDASLAQTLADRARRLMGR